jgi:hypothetical protein
LVKTPDHQRLEVTVMLATLILITNPKVMVITTKLMVVGSNPMGWKPVCKRGKYCPKVCPKREPINPPITNNITKIQGFLKLFLNEKPP